MDKSSVEIRLFDHKTNKVFYKRLSQIELELIKRVIDINWED